MGRNDTSVDAGNGIGGLRFYANDPSGFNDVGIINALQMERTQQMTFRRGSIHTTADGGLLLSGCASTASGRLLVGTLNSVAAKCYPQWNSGAVNFSKQWRIFIYWQIQQ